MNFIFYLISYENFDSFVDITRQKIRPWNIDKESIILLQYVGDCCNYSQRCHLWLTPLCTPLLHWNILLASQNDSEIIYNIFLQ